MARRPKRDPDDFAEEIRSHLEMEADELRSEGVPDAAGAARRAFGNVTAVRERSYERGRWTWLDELLQDLRYAWRTMRKAPAYSAGAALLLALGIGANTAIYSFVEAVVFRPLPVPDPNSLVLLKWHAKGNPKVKRRHTGESHTEPAYGNVSGNFPYRAFEALSRNDVLAASFAFFGDMDGATVIARGAAERASTTFVSGGFFSGLRIPMAIGRAIEAEDERPDAPAVAVLGYAYWQTRFGGEAAALGQNILINNKSFVVAGVAPKGFVGLDTGGSVAVYLPLRFCQSVRTSFAAAPISIDSDDHWYWLQMMGRLKPGVSRDRAEVALAAAWAGYVAQTAETEAEKVDLPKLHLISGATGLDTLRFYHSRPILIVAAMAALILLIACANLANLQLTRAVARRREILLRFGLGAGRWRVARQLLTESGLLSLAGGLLSLLFAWGGIRGLSVLAEVWRKDVTFRAEMNWNCLLVSAALTVITGVLFGMAPALHASRLQLAAGLREQRLGGRGRWQGRGALVTLQIALSLLLVAGASLFARSLSNLRSVPLGFNPASTLAFEANAFQAGYQGEALGRFYGEALLRLRAIPGARSVTAASYALVYGRASGASVAVPENPQAGNFVSPVMWVGPGFFTTMQIPLALGRDISDRDTRTSPMVAVVNEEFAARYLTGNPIGRQIRFGAPEDSLATVVGVARNTLLHSLKEKHDPIVFGAYTQHLSRIRDLTFFVRGASDSLSLAAPARQVVASLDSRIPVVAVRTLENQIRGRMGQERLLAILCASFAGLALVIASVGLYGALAYGVSRRSGEIGVRIALGARRGRVVAMIVRESLAMVALGLAVGLALVWSSEKVIGSFLFKASPGDPRAAVLPVAVLIVSALAAAGLPAWRAARIDPAQALRHE